MPVTLKANELWQWLAVNEERLLLHDGLTRMADHISVPSGVAEISNEDDLGLPVLDGKTPEELASIICKECSAKSTTYASLMEYRLNALRGLWQSIKELEDQRTSSTAKESSPSSQVSPSPQVSFASRVSLVLIFPIMKSLSKFDPNLSSEAASILLETLRACEPLSLSSEPNDCIAGLENLLCSWLSTARENTDVPVAQVQNAASALVALSVAVGTGSLLLRTVHILQSLKSHYPELHLLVPGVLCKLLREHVTQEDSCALMADAHLLCWGYDDGLVQDGKEGTGPRSITFDGKFVYVTSSSLKNFLKLGTGKQGTIRGYVYANRELEPGWVVWTKGKLLFKEKSSSGGSSTAASSGVSPSSSSAVSGSGVASGGSSTGAGGAATNELSAEKFCSVIERDTLKLSKSVKLLEAPTEQHHTLQFMSDGMYVYWVYVLRMQETITHPVTGDRVKEHPVYLHTLELKTEGEDSSGELVLASCGERVLLQKAVSGETDKNSDVMKALVRANPSYASSTISSLLGASRDDTSGATSTGLSIKILQKCAAYATGSAFVLLSAPPTPPGGRGGLFGVQGGSSSKALCYNICFSIQTGKSLGQIELLPTSQLHCALTKGASMMAMAACYDSRNHCVWTCNDDWIDVWDCAGKVHVAAHLIASRLGKASIAELIPPPLTPHQPHPYSSNAISVSEAISLMLRHVGIESCRLVPGCEFSTTVVHNLPLSFLEQCCDLLKCSLKDGSWDNALAVVVTLLAVLPAFLSNKKFSNDKLVPLKERVRELVWELLVNSECSEPLLAEAKKIISRNSESLYLHSGDHANFIADLLNADPSQHVLVSLRDELLVQTAHDLQHFSKLSPSTVNIAKLVSGSIVADSLSAVTQSFESSPDDLLVQTACSPVFTPSLQCAAMLLNVSLRRLVLALEERNKRKEEEVGVASEADSSKNEDGTSEEIHELEDARSALLEMCEKLNLFSACSKTLESLCDLASTLPPEVDEETTPTEPSDDTPTDTEAPPTVLRQTRLQAVERAVRGSVLGCLLQPLLAVISEPSVCTLQMANTMQMHLSSLAQLAAQACGALYAGSGSIKIPAPWATGRLVETIHPVRDNYKFKETVSFPGAKHLYLKFDPRCSSQYDYDKVIVYSGDSPSTPRVAEYGGNTHGFGSRSVLGKGWPKDLVKVEGDTVTFTFEMKSGREHSTPDRAMWGFACTVRPQEATDESPTGLPFVTDLYLSLTSVCCSLIGRLFRGPHPSSEEKTCQQLLKYDLLQKCVWRTVEGSPEELPLGQGDFPIPKPPPHTPLPPVVIKQLRDHVGKPPPTLRPSIRELIQPDLLEEVIVSACLKQYGIQSPLRLLGHSAGGGPDVESNKTIVDAIFNRINGLERRLQALAELERNWWHDVEDMAKAEKPTTTETFFFALLHHENTVKSFELLCCLKEVEINHNDLLSTAKQLQDLLELDVEKRRSQGEELLDYTPVTRDLVKGVIERAQLLLRVTLVHEETTPLISPMAKEAHDNTLTVTSPTVAYARSFSAPPTNYEAPPIRRQRSMVTRTKQSLLDLHASVDKSNLLSQIFQFIGAKPEEAVSCDSFLAAASQQWRRGVCRVRALGYLNELLTSGYVSLAVDHLLASVGAVLRQGPRVSDIACGGMAGKVREAFAEVMHAVVELASKQPSACINTIAMLCVVPYTRQEEHCLVRSGLVKLLDHLCSLVDNQKSMEVGGEEDESLHRVTSLAWAGFQVLADRCVSWETQQSAVVSSGLAQQVSLLLTNHLSRAMERLVVSETGASEGLQDALSLLLGLAKSHMGRAILSQPACVSKLLLLLTDQRPSPKLVLIALQLCRIALPLMTVAECSQVTVPPHPSLPPRPKGEATGSSLAADIVKLLLAKLAEYIVPDASQVAPKHASDDGRGVVLESDQPLLPSHVNKPFEEDLDYETGQASVFVYKRENERAADILQPLISQDPRQFRLSGHRLQEVMQMDRTLTENGKAEVATDSYRSCLRRALRWASMGFTVSIEHPSTGRGDTSTVVDKKKAKAESYAKKKNLELIKTDPPRPFVSGHVAYSLASEVIGLLHGLLTEPGAAEVWSKAIKESMLQSLSSVPQLVPKLASYADSVHHSVAIGAVPPPHGELLQEACIANATFAALGGFKESVRPGMRVRVEGEGVEDCYGVIQSISERKGLANVQFSDDEFCFSPNQTLEVPISRLFPPQKDTLPLKQLGVDTQLCHAIWSLLGTATPMLTHAHSNSDANTPALGLCRLFAELRTRASAALAYHAKESSFSKHFLSLKVPDNNGDGLTLLSHEARQSSSGLRVSLVESFCQSLRMLYRDCARPAPPRIERPRIQPKHIKLDISRPWPPVTYSSFAYSLSSITYQGPTASATPPTPAAVVAVSPNGSGSGSGSPARSQDTSSQPKGVVVYANTAIPAKSPSFYWELEICHLGESSSDAAHIAMGYSPDPQKPPEGQAWAYPTEAVLMRSSGRGCQVRGENFLAWNTFRLNNPLKSGDIVGCGWVREEESSTTGTVYFTLNGEKQANTFTGCPAEMLPFLHIQKKASRVRANFGERPFAYVEGHAHRDAADIEEEGVSMEEMVANFEALPFAMIAGSDSEGEGAGSSEQETGSVVELAQTGPPTKKMKTPIATVGYDHEASQCYQVYKSFDTMLESGPLIRPGGGVQEEESDEGEGPSSTQEEDLHALLVKAWETKVFPVIQRRFRNDQERKSGLEQIKGALQLGMESIAQETVEFLYEENGGIPRDLHLPTMDDVKAELGKFTISKVKKGSAVVVQKELPYTRCGVRTMQKTQGLTGIVLDVDESNECVQVECYLQNEGALVRFWYPVVYLERPPPGYRKSSALRGSDAANMLVHRELLRCEAALSSMYCRRALLLVQQSSTHTNEELLDHLRLVSAECLADPLCEGLSTTTSPDLAPSPSTVLQTLNLSPLHVFYASAERISAEIQSAIDSVGFGKVENLAQQVCDCLQRTPQNFGCIELKVTENKEVFDITYPDAVMMVVSCVDDKSASTKPPQSSTYKYPWARVLVYRGGQGKGGRQQMQEIARYPNEMMQSSSNQYCGHTYPSLFLPFSRIHVKFGGCNTRPGKLLKILALPPDFPLALTFAHILSRFATQVFEKDPKSESTRQCTTALNVCLESLSKLLNRLDVSIPLKELVMHQLADVMWTLCVIASQSTQLYSLPSDCIQNVKQELQKVFETESSSFSSGKGKSASKVYPPPGSLAEGDTGRFSTYFQAILEFMLAALEYQHKFHGGEPLSSVISLMPVPSVASAPALVTQTSAPSPGTTPTSDAAVPATPSSESGPGKRSAKRSRVRKGFLGKKEGGEASSSTKKDEWLTTLRAAASLLRCVALDSECERQSTQVHEASIISSQSGGSKPVSRLLVVTDINPKLDIDTVQKAIHKTCGLYGGLYRDRLYLPVREYEIEREDSREAETAEKEKKEDASPSKTTSSSPEQESTAAAPSEATPTCPTHQLVGHAVLELCSSSQTSSCSSSLLANSALQIDDGCPQISGVSNSLRCGEDEVPNQVLAEYLRKKLMQDAATLEDSAKTVLSSIFRSSLASGKSSVQLEVAQISGELLQFLNSFAEGCSVSAEEQLESIKKSHGNEQGQISLEGFLDWVVKQITEDVGVRCVWLGLLASGYDLHFEKCCFSTSDHFTCAPTREQDRALIYHVDTICRHLVTTAESLDPWDITLSDAHFASTKLAPLQGLSLADARLRFLQLKHINWQLSLLLPATDLRSTHPFSLGCLLSKMSSMMFYDVKVAFLHSVINASTRRSLDQAPPEVKMDPLESVGTVPSNPLATHFCQATQQMLSVPSAQLCVPLASGGDPTYAFNVKLSGEEVHGTSGSFRQFLWQVVRELQSTVLPILMPCPSGASGLNHGKYILAPGPMTYSEEKLLHFFGQLLGVSVRADVPFAIDFLPCFWKSFKGETLSLEDLCEADCITYNLTNKMLTCSSPEEFDELIASVLHGRGPSEEGEGTPSSVSTIHEGLKFTLTSLDGIEVELCQNGKERTVDFLNRQEYVEAVRSYRLKELTSEARMKAIHCGFASVIPLQILKVFTIEDLDLRVCGIPYIDLEYLKLHTMYQVGLMEADKHVQYFWHALESFSQDELRKFIKFACNQERIPFGHPCRDRSKDSPLHVPPYPMKIAPPDGRGPPDSRYIRAETCMFMIKLPQYSSQQIMTERLRYAIHCREDPLSG